MKGFHLKRQSLVLSLLGAVLRLKVSYFVQNRLHSPPFFILVLNVDLPTVSSSGLSSEDLNSVTVKAIKINKHFTV